MRSALAIFQTGKYMGKHTQNAYTAFIISIREILTTGDKYLSLMEQ